MEVYYKNLISKDATLENLVDDLNRVVQGVHEFADATGIPVALESRRELTSRLQQLKESCLRMKQGAIAGARATDKALRQHPYSGAGIAFALGLLAGHFLSRKPVPMDGNGC